MKKNVLKAVIVGCGKIAHVDHVPNLLKIKNVAITALYDVVPRQMSILKNAFGLDATCCDSLPSLLETKPDLVVVCTPNSFHFPQTMAALKAGCHVLCEKPMAGNTNDCSKMIQEAKARNLVLHINQTLHYLPPYVTLAELSALGTIGTIRHIRCLRYHTTTPDIGWSEGATWFVSKKYDGGIVLDIGVHMADLMKWIAGPVNEIMAITETHLKHIDVVDNASALMKFRNGASGILELSWTSPENYGLLEIYGNNGVLRMGFAPDGQIELIKRTSRGGTRVILPQLRSKVQTSQQACVDAIYGKRPSPTGGELGRDAVALCEAILQAGASGKSVKVKQF